MNYGHVSFRPSLQTYRLSASVDLVGDHVPQRQDMQHQTPRCARAYDLAQAMKDLVQAMVTLWVVLRHDGQIGDHKGPFIVTDIRGYALRSILPGVAL